MDGALVYVMNPSIPGTRLTTIHTVEINKDLSNGYKRFSNFRPLITLKITFSSANYSACVVYTKTIIHLSDIYLALCGSVYIHD